MLETKQVFDKRFEKACILINTFLLVFPKKCLRSLHNMQTLFGDSENDWVKMGMKELNLISKECLLWPSKKKLNFYFSCYLSSFISFCIFHLGEGELCFTALEGTGHIEKNDSWSRNDKVLRPKGTKNGNIPYKEWRAVNPQTQNAWLINFVVVIYWNLKFNQIFLAKWEKQIDISFTNQNKKSYFSFSNKGYLNSK